MDDDIWWYSIQVDLTHEEGQLIHGAEIPFNHTPEYCQFALIIHSDDIWADKHEVADKADLRLNFYIAQTWSKKRN